MTALELTGNVYDENQIIYNVFSAFRTKRIKLQHRLQCTNRPNTASKEVHGMSHNHYKTSFAAPVCARKLSHVAVTDTN